MGPVIVKNTFLDFDDTCLNRSSRRCKTEGAVKAESDVELYDQKRTRDDKSEGAINVEFCDNDKDASTCSPTSSYGRCTSNNSNVSEGPGVCTVPSETQKVQDKRWSAMLLDEGVPPSFVAPVAVSS